MQFPEAKIIRSSHHRNNNMDVKYKYLLPLMLIGNFYLKSLVNCFSENEDSEKVSFFLLFTNNVKVCS